jgi:hypothetical protein
MEVTPKVLKTGTVGGRSATAKSGGYNQGTTIKAEGNYRGGAGSHEDLRGGNAKTGGYNQGNQMAAQPGGDKPGTHKDLRGGSCTTGGYNQGSQHAGKTK